MRSTWIPGRSILVAGACLATLACVDANTLEADGRVGAPDASRTGAEAPDASQAHAPDAGTDTSPPPDVHPNPLGVQPGFATATAVTATLGPEGGTLSTTDGRGSTYILTVAAGILYTSTTYTLTPVETLSGASITAGVRIQPEDAVFDDGASLSVTGPAAPASGLARTGFKFYGDGDSFHLRAIDENATLTIFEGGTYGLVDLTPQTAEAYADEHLPELISDAFAQVAAALHIAGGVPGKLPLTREDKIFFAVAAYDGSLSSAGFGGIGVKAHLEDAALRRRAIAGAESRFKDWIQNLERGRLINEARIKPLVEEGWSLLAKAYGDTIERSITSCFDERKPGQRNVALYWISRARAHVKGDTLPASVLDTFNARLASLAARVDRCFVFTVKLNSDLIWANWNDAATVKVAVSAQGIVDWQTVNRIDLQPGEFSMSPTGSCIAFSALTHSPSVPGTYGVENLQVDDEIDIDENRANNVTGVQLSYNPGATLSSFTTTSTCPDSTVRNSQPFWMAMYFFLHESEQGPLAKFVTTTWDTLGSGDSFAVRTYQESLPRMGMSGTTTIRLEHTP